MTNNIAEPFFQLENDAYFLSHSIGKLPLTTKQAVEQLFFKNWEQHTANAWPFWLEQIDLFRESLATLFNAQATSFCPQSNVSSSLSKVLASLPLNKKRNKILFTEDDFPSVGFVIQKAKTLGFEIIMIPSNEDVQDIATWERYIDSSVHSVLVTHVQYQTGKRIPVTEVCALANSNQSHSIIDVAQSSGIIPIDFQQWNASFVIGSCIKWSCGGPGAGFLWVNPQQLEQCQPIDVGWFSHQNPFEFDINHFEYADSAQRFWGGTPSVVPFITARSGVEAIINIGQANISAHNQQLTKIMTAGLTHENHVSPTEVNLRGGTTILKFENNEQVEEQLKKANIKYDQRGNRLRFSPHIYTSEDDAELLNQILTTQQ